MPFRQAPGTGGSGPTGPAQQPGFVPVELAQTAPGAFTLRADLVYVEPPHRQGPAGEPGRRHVVPAGFTTDLASVPYLLWAIVGPFGRHTRAAILHDHGIASLQRPLRSPATLDRREQLDLQFRDALLDSDVPRLRAYLMWAATSVDRIVRHGSPLLAGALVVQLLAGLVCLVAAVRVGGWGAPVLLVLPLVAALAWGRARLAVALAQYAGALVLPVLVVNAVVAGVLALAGLLVDGTAPDIAPTRLGRQSRAVRRSRAVTRRAGRRPGAPPGPSGAGP